MANTITKTTSGLLGAEDFAGQTDGNVATSSYFVIVNPATPNEFRVATTGGKKCMKSYSAGTYDFTTHGVTKTLNITELVMQSSKYLITNHWFHDSYRGASGNEVHRAQLDNSLYGTGAFAINGINGNTRCYYNNTFSSGAWYYFQDKYKDNEHAHTVWNSSMLKIADWKGFSPALPSGNGQKGCYLHQNNSSYGDFRWLSSSVITFAGLVAGMTIRLLNASTEAVEFSVSSSGISATMDLLGNWFPVSKKIQILGTDGTELLKTNAQSIDGGDTWTYSGDTSTPTPNAKKIIIATALAGGF